MHNLILNNIYFVQIWPCKAKPHMRCALLTHTHAFPSWHRVLEPGAVFLNIENTLLWTFNSAYSASELNSP